MMIYDADRAMALQHAEEQAQERYLAARERGDPTAVRAASAAWSAAAQAFTDYALSGEPNSER